MPPSKAVGTKPYRQAFNTIRDHIKSLMDKRRPNAEFQRCLHCGEPVKQRTKAGSKIEKLYCNSRCGRKAHYLPFNVRLIMRGEE